MQQENVFFSIEYNKLSDEETIAKIKSGDEQALAYMLDKYKDLVHMKVGKYFMIGAEKDDIIQEGMIGLYKAIKTYDESKNNTFKTFANMCIERQLITAIKTSNRQKHMPLNSYLSLNISAYDNNNDDDSTELIDTFNSQTIEDPLETIMKKEQYTEIEKAIDKNLSDFEKKVLAKFIDGQSYIQIAESLNSPVKSIFGKGEYGKLKLALVKKNLLTNGRLSCSITLNFKVFLNKTHCRWQRQNVHVRKRR